MNAARRKSIAEQIEKLRDIASNLETLREEEQEYFDNMPEPFQCAEKGNNAQIAADNLYEVTSSIEDAINTLEEVAG